MKKPMCHGYKKQEETWQISEWLFGYMVPKKSKESLRYMTMDFKYLKKNSIKSL